MTIYFIFNTPHCKVHTLFPPERKKVLRSFPTSTLFLNVTDIYPSRRQDSPSPSAWAQTVHCAGYKSEFMAKICGILSVFGGKRVRILR